MAGFFSRLFGRTERKSAVAAPVSGVAAPSALFSGSLVGSVEITPWQAWQLFVNSAPYSKIIHLIADEVARLVPQIKINGEIVADTPIHQLLKRPGRGRDRKRFIKDLAVQQMVTGTAYPIVYGNKMAGSVLMIDIAKSQYVKPIQATTDMWPDNYWYTEGARSLTFQRDPSNIRDLAWIDSTGMAEICPIYEMDGIYRGVGLSRLNAIKYDIELRLKGMQHNASVLDNGARPSGVASFKEQLTPEQKEDVRAQFQALGAGAVNAGKVLVTDGGELDFTQLSQSMKDMDFSKLIEITEDAIASAYNVPVTLFRTSAQTNNNYATAWETFYYLAVLPQFETIYGGLSRIFSERMGVEVEITHDALTNPVLAKAASQRARELYGSHLISRNEAREICGFEPVLGGDTIYGTAGDVPQAEDYFTNHGINDPADKPSERDNSLEAYREVRPPTADAEAPTGKPETEQESRKPDKKPDASPRKPAGKPDKKPDRKPDKGDAAKAVILAFADALKAHRPSGPISSPVAPAPVFDKRGKKVA